jgi:hypothetical protein
MNTDKFEDGIEWWMDTTQPMSTALYPNPPQWHIDTGNLVRLVPQRPWVGLTAEDFSAIKFHVEMRFPAEFRAGARWAEVKLKEKNT